MPYMDETQQNIINELSNRPRYDLDKRRYGNTLSDDMFAIKNPGRANQHTPETYDYLNQTYYDKPVEPMTPVLGWDSVIPTLNPPGVTENKPQVAFQSLLAQKMPKDFRDNAVSRKKLVGGDSKDWEVRSDDWSLLDDILEFPDAYTQEQLQWAEDRRDQIENRNKVNDLSTAALKEDMRALNTGSDRPSQDMSSRRDAEYDPYLSEVVNYNAMSPTTMEQLAKMGVNRPTRDQYEELGLPYTDLDDDANESLRGLIWLYRYAMENGLR